MSQLGTDERLLRLFAMSNLLLEQDLSRVEDRFAIDLARGVASDAGADDVYYPQIETAIRAEAATMAPHYEMFYSLETTIRTLVRDSLEEAYGSAWWGAPQIIDKIQSEAEKRQKSEQDSGMTPRSDDPLAYTTFGELGEIIRSNWDIFGGIFASEKAVTRVMTNLNSLRGPIAHCSPLAEDEVVRLRLTVRDWFRLMG